MPTGASSPSVCGPDPGAGRRGPRPRTPQTPQEAERPRGAAGWACVAGAPAPRSAPEVRVGVPAWPPAARAGPPSGPPASRLAVAWLAPPPQQARPAPRAGRLTGFQKPSRGFGLRRKRGGPTRTAPPPRAHEGPIGVRCGKRRLRPWGPATANQDERLVGRANEKLPKGARRGKRSRPSAEPGGAVVGGTRALTGRGRDQ